MCKRFFLLIILLTHLQVLAQADPKAPQKTDKLPSERIQKPKMRLIGAFEAGYKDVSIYKMVDDSDDVICYVLMPENVSSKILDGKQTFDGSGVGSISCLKGK